VDAAPDAPTLDVGDSGPLETSFCQRVVDGRLAELVQDASKVPGLPETPFPVGAHLSTPIRLPDGSVYGTLCCFSTAPDPGLQQRDLTQLRHCAALVARRIDASRVRGHAPAWTLAPRTPHAPPR
jgi:GAF domain-containing protein